MRLEPKQIIQTYKQTNSAQATATILGIHKTTVYRWLRRSRSGWSNHLREGVKRKSTRPKNPRYILTSEQKLAVEDLRIERGLDARKIVYSLNLPVSHMTVYRYLKRRGLTRTVKNHRRPRLQPTIHMHAKNAKTTGCLQMDVKYLTPELTGLPWTCFEYAVIDIYSRYKDAVILNQLDASGAMAALIEILDRLPFPVTFIQTDNGSEFQSVFDKYCQDRGLKHHFIHKRSPNENAVIERSFRTDEEEFLYFQKTPFTDYDDLRDRYTQWLHYYNYERPHLGIDLKTPSEVVAEVVLH